jgi:hypothetical protein
MCSDATDWLSSSSSASSSSPSSSAETSLRFYETGCDRQVGSIIWLLELSVTSYIPPEQLEYVGHAHLQSLVFDSLYKLASV